MNANNFCEIYKNFECQINPTIYKYLLMLMKYIFIGKDNFKNKDNIDKLINKLKQFTTHINQNIIKKKENFIEIEPINKIYTFKNFLNIINFVKSQNLMFAGNILEGILIIIFSYSIEVPKEDEFGKLIYLNISKLREPQNEYIPKWFSKAEKTFQHEELKNIQNLLERDIYIKSTEKELYQIQDTPVLLKLLLEIMKIQLNFLYSNMKNSICTKCINNGILKIMDVELALFQNLKNNTSNNSGLDTDLVINSIASLYHYIFIKEQAPIRIIRCFLISVYIYYQNKNSQYIKSLDSMADIDKNQESDLVDVPFTYELRGANVEGRFSHVIISPISIEPRIINVDFSQNNIREPGLYEFGKLLTFNKKIKSINLQKGLLRGYHLYLMNTGFGIYNNYNLEYLNLSFCYLNNNIEYSLPELLNHLKGLKTLNLSGNEIKEGVKTFFVKLKKLYRNGNTKLERLYLNNCILDQASLYELSELLKSPLCGLKSLSLGVNPKINILNFLKKIKVNKSLEELNICRCDLDDNDIDDVCRIFSHTNLKYLNLFKNNFHNFAKCLRILFRSKIIKQKNEIIDKSNIKLNSSLMNLDFSNNVLNPIDYRYIKIINEDLFPNKTTLSCLDFSHILFGPYPEKPKKMIDVYKGEVENMESALEKNREHNLNLLIKRRDNKINIQRYESEEAKLEDLDAELIDYINKEILSNELVIHPAFLREKCLDLIRDKIFENKEKYQSLINEEGIKEIFDFTSEENDSFIKKLMDYIIYLKSKNEIVDINLELERKNLIII